MKRILKCVGCSAPVSSVLRYFLSKIHYLLRRCFIHEFKMIREVLNTSSEEVAVFLDLTCCKKSCAWVYSWFDSQTTLHGLHVYKELGQHPSICKRRWYSITVIDNCASGWRGRPAICCLCCTSWQNGGMAGFSPLFSCLFWTAVSRRQSRKDKKQKTKDLADDLQIKNKPIPYLTWLWKRWCLIFS